MTLNLELENVGCESVWQEWANCFEGEIWGSNNHSLRRRWCYELPYINALLLFHVRVDWPVLLLSRVLTVRPRIKDGEMVEC